MSWQKTTAIRSRIVPRPLEREIIVSVARKLGLSDHRVVIASRGNTSLWRIVARTRSPDGYAMSNPLYIGLNETSDKLLYYYERKCYSSSVVPVYNLMPSVIRTQSLVNEDLTITVIVVVDELELVDPASLTKRMLLKTTRDAARKMSVSTAVLAALEKQS